jgi:predicted nucleic acid-binding protein
VSAVLVVFDVNVLIGAVAGGRSDFESWPSPPPTSDNPFADCLGITNDAKEFALCLSDHILENVAHVLTDDEYGFAWEPAVAEEYVDVLWDIAEASGGGVFEPQHTVHDCVDYEDNRILEAALDSGAQLIVSDDHHLLDMNPWRGIPIITPREFASRTDAMRRQERRSHRGRR